MPDTESEPGATQVTPDDVVEAEVVPVEAAPVSAGPASTVPDVGYTPDGVPTFDYARERIESRYGAAIGSAELAADSPEGRSVEEQYDARQKAAAERLAQIRESMRGEELGDA